MAGPTLSTSGYYNNGSNGFSTGSIALTIATKGDLLLVALEVDTGTAPTSVSDTQGNTYTLAETMAFAGSAVPNAKVFLYGATAGAAGADTVTVTFSATASAQFIWMDWVNGSLSSGNNSVGTLTTGTATGSLTTAVASCVVVGWIFFGRPTGTTTFSMVPTGTVLESGGASPNLAILTQYAAEATLGTAVTASGSESDGNGSTIVMFEVDPAVPPPPPAGSFSLSRAMSSLLTALLHAAGALVLSVTATATPTSGSSPLSVSFTTTVSGGVSPYTYAWTFGDGGTSTAQNPTHSYVTVGSYTPKVTVTDSVGDTGSATASVSVSTAVGGAGAPFPISRRVRFG